MAIPRLLSLERVRETVPSASDESLFDLGLAGVLRFYVVLPEPAPGAYRLDMGSLGQFMAGADHCIAKCLPDHWSPQTLSGEVTISRSAVRVLEEDWQQFMLQSAALLKVADAAGSEQEPGDRPERVIHLTKANGGGDRLTAIIIKASAECVDPSDAEQVFAKLAEWAQSKRYPALVKFDDETDAILWKDGNGGSKDLKLDALKKRLKRLRDAG